MGNPKTMSDEDLAALGTDLSRMLEAAVSAWEHGMKVLPINSREYKAICSAGKKTQAAYILIRDEAHDREWPCEKVDRVFSSKTGCGFG